MDINLVKQLREKTTALEAAQEELAALRAEREAVSQELERERAEKLPLHRAQRNGDEAVRQQLREIKGAIERVRADIPNQLIDDFSRSVTPHLKLTRKEVEDLTRAQVELRGHLDATLGEFEARLKSFAGLTTGAAQQITDDFIKKVNAAWDTMQKKQATAQAELEKHQALNATMLGQHRESVVELINVVNRHGQQFINYHQNLTTVAAAIERLEKLTGGQLDEMAKKAQRTITEASQTAEREIAATRQRTRRALVGLDRQLDQHPFLMLVLVVVFVASISVMLAGGLTTFMVERRLGHLVPEIVEQMRGKLEEAELWEAYLSEQNDVARDMILMQAREAAKKQGRMLPGTKMENSPIPVAPATPATSPKARSR